MRSPCALNTKQNSAQYAQLILTYCLSTTLLLYFNLVFFWGGTHAAKT